MNEFGTPELSEKCFSNIVSLLYKESGITIKPHKKYLVVNRLSRFVGANKPYPDFETYFQSLKKNRKLLIDFIDVLTTNFSYFYREPLHFDTLQEYLQKKADSESYIRLWSAACSTGEEPYSMAITCFESLQNLRNYDLKILATDISSRVLKKAISGEYIEEKIKDYISPEKLKKYFIVKSNEGHLIVKPEIAKIIAFRYLNLLEEYPFSKKFDVVFLRNVLIYFENKEKEIIINKISRNIKPNGLLILGLSESLVGIKHPLISVKNSVYQKRV